ncbi:Acetamidase/formamidase [Quadrisphaera granulorum]|uniref:Acetamidase/formamidase n=1 Tax=Quadrisphaera granulorum TaxID=317664 RepID=A0A316AWP4_9ACTN|nr:acetamidase/formamidase family protein [Quadrisphaera granulorum]PWJ54587.1 acetamidase/formamidase [Quadrisphaera granulorum]SZE95949.1 Acetamidase/formamidase [Quadrisphaera granulorum]
MEVVEVHPSVEQYAYTFGGAAPLRSVRPGQALRLWSEDAFGGSLRTTADVTSNTPPAPGLNPQTGPFFVEGAKPGDVLALHLVDLEPARDTGVSSLVPFFGGLTGTDTTALLTPSLPERTWIYHLDSARRTLAVELTAGGSREAFSVELPLDPMLGTVGVAPAAGEVRTSLVPGVFGGNLDTPQMRAGTTCYLRVNVEGALFSLGDGHYRQGEGETCGTAVEGAMTTTLVVDLVSSEQLASSSMRTTTGAPASAPATPRLEDDDHWITVGTGRPLEDAWRASQVEMVRWLRDLFGLDDLDAYQLLSQVGLAPLANVVDPAYAALAKVPKALLPAPAGGAFGGVHARLRAAASTLR